MKIWEYMRPNKENFSAFYFANLWFCFASYFILESQIRNLGVIMQSIFIKDLKVTESSASAYYWSLILVYFVLTFIIMSFVMKPLNIHIPDIKVETWETVLTFICVAGFFFYSFHKVFQIGMPDGTPSFMVKLIMGSQAYYLDPTKTLDSTSMFWGNISDVVWNFFPLAFMWYRAKTGGGD